MLPLDHINAKILATLYDYPFASLSTLSDASNCSVGKVFNYLTEVLRYKNYALQWVHIFKQMTSKIKE